MTAYALGEVRDAISVAQCFTALIFPCDLSDSTPTYKAGIAAIVIPYILETFPTLFSVNEKPCFDHTARPLGLAKIDWKVESLGDHSALG